MKIKTTLAVLALSLAPTLSLAGPGCSGMERTKVTASSCAEGAVWDEVKGACVATTS
jgi:hypothetical protein